MSQSHSWHFRSVAIHNPSGTTILHPDSLFLFVLTEIVKKTTNQSNTVQRLIFLHWKSQNIGHKTKFSTLYIYQNQTKTWIVRNRVCQSTYLVPSSTRSRPNPYAPYLCPWQCFFLAGSPWNRQAFIWNYKCVIMFIHVLNTV